MNVGLDTGIFLNAEGAKVSQGAQKNTKKFKEIVFKYSDSNQTA